jgi:HD domain-containing protein
LHPDSIRRAPARTPNGRSGDVEDVITEVTERIHTDTALGPAAAPPRRVAGRFAGLPMAQAALRFARARHAGQHREIDHAPFIAHPIEVGSLLHGDGQPDEIIAAGLLHDILEKTATTSAELHRRFGPRIARLVESVSDDPSIGDYKSRKRDLRDRIARSDSNTRAIFAADKISKVRELAQLPARRLGETKVHAELAHYRASLEMLRRVDGDVPLVDRLDAELDQLLVPAVAGTPCSGPIASGAGSKRTLRRAPAI